MDLAKLSDALRDGVSYPAEMTFVETGILGRGFYPGCRGFSPQRDPAGGVMLLGRDFGTRQYYQSLAGPAVRDEYALTWRHTREVYLSAAAQPTLDDLPVWCTNYLMGVRNRGSARGNMKEMIPREPWQRYESSCWDFLSRQVLLQKPAVIVVFGADNRTDLLQENRIGAEWHEVLLYTFECAGQRHSALVTFACHPHSLIRKAAKVAARPEVERIRALYLSQRKETIH